MARSALAFLACLLSTFLSMGLELLATPSLTVTSSGVFLTFFFVCLIT